MLDGGHQREGRALPGDGVTRGGCRLCFDGDLLKMNVAVGFRVHGQSSHAAMRALRMGSEES